MRNDGNLQRALDLEDNQVPCQNAPDLFFPKDVDYNNRGETDYWHAKMLCATCPIMDTCLQHALDNHIYDGMWGGVSPAERKRMNNARRYAA